MKFLELKAFSREQDLVTVLTLWGLSCPILTQAAKYLNVEIIELHHDKKKDAPSGTAIKTLSWWRKFGNQSSKVRWGRIDCGCLWCWCVFSVRLPPGLVARKSSLAIRKDWPSVMTPMIAALHDSQFGNQRSCQASWACLWIRTLIMRHANAFWISEGFTKILEN